jgi:hypothetical protein
MRVATGPGKIDDKPAPGPWRFGLLFNFDIDDASVKLEHQTWLQKVVVPVAKASGRVEVLLKGTASRSGSKLYNEALSQRRVEAIQKCLIAHGVAGDRIKLTWVGELEAELAGQKDGTENERDRAVGVLVRRKVPSAPRFERVIPTDDEDGFEPLGAVPWLMVPATDGERTLRLRNAGGLTLRSSNPSVLRVIDPATLFPAAEVIVPDDNERITFRGGLPGTATVFGRDLDGKETPLLSVDVLPRRNATVGFYYVTDKAKHHTTRTVGEEKKLLEVANRVYNRQANVFFDQKEARPLTVDEDWGEAVGYDDLGGVNLTKLRTLGNTGLRVRVFFVWVYETDADDTTDTNAEVDDFGGVVVVMEDEVGSTPGRTLSHEFGHNLGLEHRKTSKRLVMWPNPNRTAARLERDQILIVNKNLAPK